MTEVKITVVKLDDGWLATATNCTGGTVVEWFHPVRETAIGRTRDDVRRKVPNAVVRVEGKR